jgi:hypothetical protein
MGGDSSVLMIGRPGVLSGDNVEVRTQYQTGQWAHGNEIVDIVLGGYRGCRRGSRELLPEVFEPDDVRLDGDQ